MSDVPLRDYVDSRFAEMDKRVDALRGAHRDSQGTTSLIISWIALFLTVINLAVFLIIETRK